MNNTKINWTNKTWNPVTGCTKYSPGCEHCYAENITRRFPNAYPNGFNVTLYPERLDEPKHVKKPTTFFVCSMADLFHKNVPDMFIDRVMQTIRECPQHTFQILTKRSNRMHEYVESVPNNCWLGVTVEDSVSTYRIDQLADIKNCNVRFLSCEPLLSDLGTLDLTGIDWVIVGGESGNQARPMKKKWVLNIQRQCEEQGVPFFFKSWGRYGENGKPCPKDQRELLDGQIIQQWPKGWKGGEK